MQTLRLLGVEVAGQAFHDDFSHAQLNKKGYWQLPMKETISGINTDVYKGKAVKLFGYQFYMTEPQYIEKVIVCTRDKKVAAESSLALLMLDGYLFGVPPTMDFAKRVWDANYDYINKKIEQFPHITIAFEDMLHDTKPTVDKIAEFVGKQVPQAAIENVEV